MPTPHIAAAEGADRFVVEAAGHLADFGPARYFITFHGGLGYHF